MKSLIMSVLFLFIAFESFCQSLDEKIAALDEKNLELTLDNIKFTTSDVLTMHANYANAYKQKSQGYANYGNPTGNVIHNSELDRQVLEIFNKLIFGNTDLVSNASAFGLVVDEEKTTASVGGNFKLNDATFVNLKFNAQGKGSTFNFYNDNSWQSTAGASLGIKRRLFPSARFHDTSIDVKEQNYRIRQYKFTAYNEYATKNFTILNYMLIEEFTKTMGYSEPIINDVYEQQGFNLSLSEMELVLKSRFPTFELLMGKNKKEEAYTYLLKIQSEMIAYFKKSSIFNSNSLDKINQFAISQMVAIDTARVKMYGHCHLFWLDADLSTANSLFNFVDDNITYADPDTFPLERKTNVWNVGMTANINYSYEDLSAIYYVKVGASLNSGSFLNSSLISGTPQLTNFDDVSDQYRITDSRDRVLGNYRDIDNNFQTGSFNFYVAGFFTKTKNIGFNVGYDHEYLVNRPSSTSYVNNFTLLGGPLLKTKDGSTFGLDFGFANAPYSGIEVGQDFIARIRVGIPFNLVGKKK